MIRSFLGYQSKNKRRDLVSTTAHILLNIALAVSIAIALVVFSSYWLAIVLLVLSKWRVFAVKPRFWWANIQSNAVDFIVGLGYITQFSQIPTQQYVSQAVVFLAYIFWLLIIKPRSGKHWVVSQGLVALYIGTSALLSIGYDWPSFVLLGLLMLVCFVTQRHVLAVYDLDGVNYHAALVALVSGEFLWVSSHWVVAYSLPLKGLYLTQPALIIVLLMIAVQLVLERVLTKHNSSEGGFKDWSGALRPALLPIILCLVVVLILLVVFSKPLVGGI